MPLPEELITIIETQLYVDDYEWVETIFKKTRSRAQRAESQACHHTQVGAAVEDVLESG